MSQRSTVAVAGALAALAIGGAVLLVRQPPPGRPPPNVSGAPAPAPPRLDARMNAPPELAAKPPAPPSPPAPPKLDTPRATVETELALLEKGDAARFAETFVPALRARVTPETVAACRAFVASHPVRPDWETAESSSGLEGRVVRVSMFGKSLTGFHESAGKWLADGVWCVPPALP